MIEFEALDVYSGWKVHSIPDALSIEMRLESTEHRFSISIVDLIRIYSVVRQRDEEKFVDYGTGGIFELEDIKDDIGYIRMPPIWIGLSMQALEDALEDVLREVFVKCDEIDGEKTREEEFPDIQRMLEKRDCDVDIRELYDRLSDSPGS